MAKKKSVVKGKKSEKKVEKVEADNIEESKDEEPKWYHYAIVSAVFILFFAGLYFVLDHFEDKAQNNSRLVVYDYFYKQGDREGKIQLHTPIDEVEDLDYIIAISKFELLNTEEFYFSFLEYNGTDNGEITRTSGRLVPFLSKVYGYNIDVSHINNHSYTCENSNPNIRVIEFNPYSDKNGVFFNTETGCIEFLTDEPEKMKWLGDKFFYTIVNE